MARGNHDLCIFHSDRKVLLFVDICMKGVIIDSGDDEEIFTIKKNSALNVVNHREGKFYNVDAVIVE